MTLSDLFADLVTILPVAFLFLWGCVLLLVDAWLPAKRRALTAALAALGFMAALALSLVQTRNLSQSGFGGLVMVDGAAVFLEVLLAGGGLVGVALAAHYLKRTQLERGEYYVLLTFSVAGMMLLSAAADLIVIFLSLELFSIPLYILTGLGCQKADCPRPKAGEAAVKYFILGSVSGAVVLYGVALIFGGAGTTHLAGIAAAIEAGQAQTMLLLVGGALIITGLGFKVSVVPFHMWTPDVYQGAPTALTAFMALGAKAAGFAGLMRMLLIALPSVAKEFAVVLAVSAALTMVFANFAALLQSNLKRLLAYSSVAHAGYLLTALAVFNEPGIARQVVASLLFYLVAYGLANFGSWAVVIAVEDEERGDVELQHLAGLGWHSPFLALVMAVCMFSLTGVPPTLGFVGKYYLFRTAMEGSYLWLVIVGVLTSLLSAYYYLRVVMVMYMQEGQPQTPGASGLVRWVAGGSAIALVLLTIFASPLFGWAGSAFLATP